MTKASLWTCHVLTNRLEVLFQFTVTFFVHQIFLKRPCKESDVLKTVYSFVHEVFMLNKIKGYSTRSEQKDLNMKCFNVGKKTVFHWEQCICHCSHRNCFTLILKILNDNCVVFYIMHIVEKRHQTDLRQSGQKAKKPWTSSPVWWHRFPECHGGFLWDSSVSGCRCWVDQRTSQWIRWHFRVTTHASAGNISQVHETVPRRYVSLIANLIGPGFLIQCFYMSLWRTTINAVMKGGRWTYCLQFHVVQSREDNAGLVEMLHRNSCVLVVSNLYVLGCWSVRHVNARLTAAAHSGRRCWHLTKIESYVFCGFPRNYQLCVCVCLFRGIFQLGKSQQRQTGAGCFALRHKPFANVQK